MKGRTFIAAALLATFLLGATAVTAQPTDDGSSGGQQQQPGSIGVPLNLVFMPVTGLVNGAAGKALPVSVGTTVSAGSAAGNGGNRKLLGLSSTLSSTLSNPLTVAKPFTQTLQPFTQQLTSVPVAGSAVASLTGGGSGSTSGTNGRKLQGAMDPVSGLVGGLTGGSGSGGSGPLSALSGTVGTVTSTVGGITGGGGSGGGLGDVVSGLTGGLTGGG